MGADRRGLGDGEHQRRKAGRPRAGEQGTGLHICFCTMHRRSGPTHTYTYTCTHTLSTTRAAPILAPEPPAGTGKAPGPGFPSSSAHQAQLSGNCHSFRPELGPITSWLGSGELLLQTQTLGR